MSDNTTLARKALLAVGIKVLERGIGYVGLFFVARLMGPEALGIVGFGFAYVGIFNFIADMGLGVAHIKKLSEGKEPAACIGALLLLRSILTAMMALTVVGSVLLLKHHGHVFESPAHERVIYIATAALALNYLADVIRSTFAARRQTAKQMLPQFVDGVAQTILKVIVATVGLGILMLATAPLIGAAIGLVVSIFLFRGQRITRPNRELIRSYCLFALPVMVIVSSNAITENLDKTMIQFFRNSEHVGYYVGAGRISSVLLFVGSAVGTLLFPTLSELNSKANSEGVIELIQNAERYLSILLLPIGILVTLLCHTIVTLLLGARFAPSANTLVALTWSTIVVILSVPYSTQIIGSGRVKLSARLSILLMVLNFSLNSLLIPARLGPVRLAGLGAMGAALATLGASTIMALVYRYYGWRFLRIRLNTDLLKHLLSALIMMTAIRSLLPGPYGIVRALASVGLGCSVYGLALALLGELRRKDFIYLKQILSPSRMGSYVVGELREDREPPRQNRQDGKGGRR